MARADQRAAAVARAGVPPRIARAHHARRKVSAGKLLLPCPQARFVASLRTRGEVVGQRRRVLGRLDPAGGVTVAPASGEESALSIVRPRHGVLEDQQRGVVMDRVGPEQRVHVDRGDEQRRHAVDGGGPDDDPQLGGVAGVSSTQWAAESTTPGAIRVPPQSAPSASPTAMRRSSGRSRRSGRRRPRTRGRAARGQRTSRRLWPGPHGEPSGTQCGDPAPRRGQADASRLASGCR